jgi:hypothetical protein
MPGSRLEVLRLLVQQRLKVPQFLAVTLFGLMRSATGTFQRRSAAPLLTTESYQLPSMQPRLNAHHPPDQPALK